MLKGQIKAKTFFISIIYSLEISKFQKKFRYEFWNLSKSPVEFRFSVKFSKTVQAKESETRRGVTWSESKESLQSCEGMD